MCASVQYRANEKKKQQSNEYDARTKFKQIPEAVTLANCIIFYVNCVSSNSIDGNFFQKKKNYICNLLYLVHEMSIENVQF